jgi:hypothetical protein
MDKPPVPLPTLDTTLAEYPHVEIPFACGLCPRGGASRLAACVARFGPNATLGELLYRFIRRCPNSPYDLRRKPQKYGRKCAARIEGVDPKAPTYIPSMLVLEIEESIWRKRYLGP